MKYNRKYNINNKSKLWAEQEVLFWNNLAWRKNKKVNLKCTKDSDKQTNHSVCPCVRFPPENHSAPPDVTGYSSDSSHSRHRMANMGTIARNTQKYGNAERMETGDGKSRRRRQQQQQHGRKGAQI